MKKLIFTLLFLFMGTVCATAGQRVIGDLSVSGDLTVGTNKLYVSSGGVYIGPTNHIVIDPTGITTFNSTSDLSASGDLTVTSTQVFFNGLASGSTEPAGVVAGQLWLDTDDRTLKVGT